MAKSDQPADPTEQPRLSDRQWEVLGRVVKGESVARETGKRIDLTLKSLVNRGLIETVAAPGRATDYRATAAGQSAFQFHSKPAEPKAPEAENSEVLGAGDALTTRVIAPGARGVREEEVEEAETKDRKFVPRKGQIVWNLDGAGDRKNLYYRVVDVGVLDAKLETWSGDSWEPVAARQRFGSLEPLSEDELAEAKRAGVLLAND
jgi:hypothetical protein